MSYAIFNAAGVQVKAAPGERIRVPLLGAEPGTTVTFDQVLLASDGDAVRTGQPTIAGATVVAEVVRHGKGDKIVIFKHKRRKNYRRKQGHRQQFTEIRVTDLKLG